jgi:RimJ/RimL family protein N-acetyltransferase
MTLVDINRDGTLAALTGPLPEVTQSVIKSTVRLYSSVGWSPPWIGYLAFEDQACVGTCAFKGAPKDGSVEIAYFTFPGHENRGVATRMAERLISIARLSAPKISVTAQTLPQENASTRVLRKAGFILRGPVVHPEDGLVWEWCYEEKKA